MFGRTICTKGRSRLGDLIHRRFDRIILFTGRVGTVKRADRAGMEFDNELLDGVFHALALSNRHFDGAIVFACRQLALHKDMRAFDESVGELREGFPERNDAMPLRLFLPAIVLVLPGALGCDREFRDGSAIWQRLGLGVLADKSDDRKLIEIH